MSTPLPIHHHPNYLQIQHLAQQILTFSQPRIRSKTEDSCPLSVVPAVEYDALHRLACSLARALIENHPPRTCSITLTEKQWLSIEASLNTHPSNENPHGPGWSSPDLEDAVTHFNKALRQQLHPANAPSHASIAVKDIIEKWNNEATLQEESASESASRDAACSRIRVTLEIADPEVVADYKNICDELLWEDLVNGELINFAEFVSRENVLVEPSGPTPRSDNSPTIEIP